MWADIDAYSLHEVNLYRISSGVQPIAFDTHVEDAAHTHSQWLLDNDVFVHSSPVTDVGNAGFEWRAGTFGWFQNHEWGAGFLPKMMSVGTPAADQYMADLFLDGYKVSPDHNTNLLNPEHMLGGISQLQGEFAGRTDAYVNTQDFGWNARTAFILGFAYHDSSNNGRMDVGEGLGNVPIRIENVSTHQVLSLTTDATGYYGVEVGAGTWNIYIGNSGIKGPPTTTVTTTTHNVMVDKVI
jgi:hypothetical protein